MLHSFKLFHFSPKLAPLSPNSKIIQRSPSLIKCNASISRRDLTLFTNSSVLLLLSSQSLEPLDQIQARSEEELLAGTDGDDAARVENATSEGLPVEIENSAPEAEIDNRSSSPVEVSGADDDVDVQTTARAVNDRSNGDENAATKRAFLDVSIDGKAVGRIVIGLYAEDVPVGVARFSSLVSGTAGISYRRKEFIKILPNYVQHGGIRSYGVDAELSGRKGTTLEAETLLTEWETEYTKRPGVKNEAGTISIIVRDPLKPPPKLKLVARQGKLKIEEEEVGTDPNGTEFIIALKDSPELDSSTLVIGKVLDGMDVAERIGQVKTVQENTTSPYFRVAKLIGDKRAVVAERGFNRPYSKVIITNCGLIP